MVTTAQTSCIMYSGGIGSAGALVVHSGAGALILDGDGGDSVGTSSPSLAPHSIPQLADAGGLLSRDDDVEADADDGGGGSMGGRRQVRRPAVVGVGGGGRDCAG
jgi:hypothetical protein